MREKPGEPSGRRWYPIGKRAFDLMFASLGLVVLSPVLATIAIAVRASSPGPVFYRGVRVGQGGRQFRIWKFRTMQRDSERHGTTTRLGDSRITPVGGLLRRFKLDELPQLINVLTGEMSIVGPRPEVEEHTKEYTPEEQSILTVPPGITDYSSIRFAALDEVLGSENPHQVYVTRIRAEKNQLRLKYVANRSFREDLRIIAATVGAIAKKARKPVSRPRSDN